MFPWCPVSWPCLPGHFAVTQLLFQLLSAFHYFYWFSHMALLRPSFSFSFLSQEATKTKTNVAEAHLCERAHTHTHTHNITTVQIFWRVKREKKKNTAQHNAKFVNAPVRCLMLRRLFCIIRTTCHESSGMILNMTLTHSVGRAGWRCTNLLRDLG